MFAKVPKMIWARQQQSINMLEVVVQFTFLPRDVELSNIIVQTNRIRQVVDTV